MVEIARYWNAPDGRTVVDLVIDVTKTISGGTTMTFSGALPAGNSNHYDVMIPLQHGPSFNQLPLVKCGNDGDITITFNNTPTASGGLQYFLTTEQY